MTDIDTVTDTTVITKAKENLPWWHRGTTYIQHVGDAAWDCRHTMGKLWLRMTAASLLLDVVCSGNVPTTVREALERLPSNTIIPSIAVVGCVVGAAYIEWPNFKIRYNDAIDQAIKEALEREALKDN